MLDLIKKITNAPAVSGREKEVYKIIRPIIEPLCDECYNDNMGNLIAVIKGTGNGKKIMLCAHADEIGFMVTFIEDSGYVRCAPIGGINYVSAAYNTVVFENGTRGVIVPESDVKPADFAQSKFYIDLGAKDKAEAEKLIKIGDCCVVTPNITPLCSTRLAGRPLDDRIGCVALILIAEELRKSPVKDDVYFVFSVQEEVGCRGAKTAAFGISPDFGIVYDVTGTGDAIGAKPMACKVGGGAAVKVKDSSVICDVELVDKLMALATENGINHQAEILTYGGTDASSMQMSGFGCRVGGLSIPTKYIHSNVELIDTEDVDACVKLTVAFLKSEK